MVIQKSSQKSSGWTVLQLHGVHCMYLYFLTFLLFPFLFLVFFFLILTCRCIFRIANNSVVRPIVRHIRRRPSPSLPGPRTPLLLMHSRLSRLSLPPVPSVSLGPLFLPPSSMSWPHCRNNSIQIIFMYLFIFYNIHALVFDERKICCVPRASLLLNYSLSGR